MIKRRRHSSIDKLPPEVRTLIGELRQSGHTIDAIMAQLAKMLGDDTPSRSALGRHVAKIAELGERMAKSRMLAEQLTSRFGDTPDNRLARLNLELMHDVMLRVITASEIDETTGEAREVTFAPEDVMFLARSLQSLASAQKADEDRLEKAVARAEERAKKAAAAAATSAARDKGLSADVVDAIRRNVLGLPEAA